MIENRKFIRLKVMIPVEYRILKKHKRQKTFSSFMKNISVGGLSIIAKEPLRERDLVQLEIHAPHLEDSVRVLGDVTWFSRSGDKNNPLHEAGIRFQEVDPGELNKILDYVYSVAIG